MSSNAASHAVKGRRRQPDDAHRSRALGRPPVQASQNKLTCAGRRAGYGALIVTFFFVLVLVWLPGRTLMSP